MAVKMSPAVAMMLVPPGQTMLAPFVSVNAPPQYTRFSSPLTAEVPKLVIAATPVMVTSEPVCAPRSTVAAEATDARPPPICGHQMELATSMRPFFGQLTPSKIFSIGNDALVVSIHVWNCVAALFGPLAGADDPLFFEASAFHAVLHWPGNVVA